MNKEEYIDAVLFQILDKHQKPFVEKEMNDHIDDRMDYYLSAGYAADVSEQKALEHMGDAKEIGMKMNRLYDCKKYNTFSLIGLIILGGNVLLSVIYFLLQFNYMFGFNFIEEWILFLCCNTMPFYFLVIALVYIFCSKTKNYSHLTALGILSYAFFIRYIFAWCSGYYFDASDYSILYFFETALEILSGNIFNIFFSVSLFAFLFFGILTSIMAMGYGRYIKSYLNGASKTAVMHRYERFRFVPIIVYSVYAVSFCVIYILMLKGVFLNA